MPSICIFVCMKMFLIVVVKDEHTSNDSFQSDSTFLSRKSMMTNTTSSYIIEIHLFACSLHRKFALFCTPYYLWYGIEIFSDYVLQLDVNILVWKFKKSNAKYRQIDFLSFTFKPEVRSCSEMFVITKWKNQDLFCLGFLYLLLMNYFKIHFFYKLCKAFC